MLDKHNTRQAIPTNTDILFIGRNEEIKVRNERRRKKEKKKKMLNEKNATRGILNTRAVFEKNRKKSLFVWKSGFCFTFSGILALFMIMYKQ